MKVNAPIRVRVKVNENEWKLVKIKWRKLMKVNET